jgi:hypothetical protein
MRQSHDEDWTPMARAVQHLQSLTVAPHLYAFTSLWRFCLTTAPTYQEQERHCAVAITWLWRDRRFHVACSRLADGWVGDAPPDQFCEESDLATVIGPFIQQLLAASPGHESHDPAQTKGSRHAGFICRSSGVDACGQCRLGSDD